MRVASIDFMDKNSLSLFAESIHQTGFAILSHHPLDQNLIKETYLDWKAFFASAEKFNFQYDQKSLDGYFPFGLEKGRPGSYADLKEFFYFYPWGKCPNTLREKTLILYSQFVELGEKLLGALESYLPSEIKAALSMPLTKMVEKSIRAVLRVLHYPALGNLKNNDPGMPKNTLRAAEHEDLTLISLVMPLVGSGLQLKDNEGEWHSVPATTEQIVVNAGDMLKICTQGFYQATTHRVLTPNSHEENASRYAYAFFLNPHGEVMLDANHTAQSFLTQHIEKKLVNY